MVKKDNNSLRSPDLSRHIWWADHTDIPERLIARIMVMGTWEDILACAQRYGQEGFAKVLDNPPRGLFDAKSWNFWHKKMGRIPVPPLPKQFVPWPAR